MADRSTEPRGFESVGLSSGLAGNLSSDARWWLYPRMYSWFLILAALDVLLTYMILSPLFGTRGREVNAVAEWVISRYGLPGMVVYKYSLVALVVLICEYVGRRHPSKGRKLAEWSVAITAVPVVVSMVLMLVDVYAIAHPIDDPDLGGMVQNSIHLP